MEMGGAGGDRRFPAWHCHLVTQEEEQPRGIEGSNWAVNWFCVCWTASPGSTSIILCLSFTL